MPKFEVTIKIVVEVADEPTAPDLATQAGEDFVLRCKAPVFLRRHTLVVETAELAEVNQVGD